MRRKSDRPSGIGVGNTLSQVSPAGLGLEPKREREQPQRESRAFRERGAWGCQVLAGCPHAGHAKAFGTRGSERAPCLSWVGHLPVLPAVRREPGGGAGQVFQARVAGCQSQNWTQQKRGLAARRANRTSVRVGGGSGAMALCLLGTMTCRAEFKSNQAMRQARSAKHR